MHKINILKNKFFSFFYKKNNKPIFILGNQKSGTTVISNLLSIATSKSLTSDIERAIPHVTMPLEISFNLISFSDFVNNYKYEFSKDIIKEPILSYYIDELLNEFPDAKFILIIRDPFQNIRSILNRLRIPGNLKKIDFDKYDELIKTPVWKLALQSNMLGVFSSNYIEAMANRWNYVVNSYLKYSDKIHLVKYEDFLQNKESFIYDLSSYLGLEVVNDIHEKVNFQYQSKGNADIDLQEFFGEDNFSLISNVCEINLKHMGYNL